MDQSVTITGDELFHLRNVNRAKPGDEIEVIDGKGSLYYGRLRDIGREVAAVDIYKQENLPKPPVRVVVAPSLIKKKAMHLMVEKLAEIGVDEIRPVIFTHTDEKFSPGMLKKWQLIAIQSLKVNKRLWASGIFPPVTLEQLLSQVGPMATNLVLDIAGQPLNGLSLTLPALAIIGPPGDFIDQERLLLRDKGFFLARINDCILKTDTAALSIAAILKTKEVRAIPA